MRGLDKPRVERNGTRRVSAVTLRPDSWRSPGCKPTRDEMLVPGGPHDSATNDEHINSTVRILFISFR